MYLFERFLRLRKYLDSGLESLPEKEKPFGMLCRALHLWQDPTRSLIPWILSNDTPELMNTQATLPEVDNIDTYLSAFVETHPGIIESELVSEANHDTLRQLASPESKELVGGGYPLLSVLLGGMQPKEGELLWRTCRSMDRAKTLRFFVESYIRYRNILAVTDNIHHGMLGYLRYLGRNQTEELLSDMPPFAWEMRDYLLSASDTNVLSSRASLPPLATLPELLPVDAELATWSADCITQTLSEYRNLSPDDYQRYLIQENFLAQNETIGEVVARLVQAFRDTELLGKAKWLPPVPWQREQGIRVDRSASEMSEIAILQDRLHDLFGTRIDLETGEWLGNQPPFEVEQVISFGHHQDPFHSNDTYNTSWEVGGSAEFSITNRQTGEKIHFGNMLPYLIRRACFFEGNVPYRLDPAKACRVLEPLLRRER